jgi:hypothetical protein
MMKILIALCVLGAMIMPSMALSTQVGPFENNTDWIKLRTSTGMLSCIHLPANAYTFVNENYFILWSLEEWNGAVAASGLNETEFMANIWRAPGKIGVAFDARCDYCKAGEPVPPEIY